MKKYKYLKQLLTKKMELMCINESEFLEQFMIIIQWSSDFTYYFFTNILMQFSLICESVKTDVKPKSEDSKKLWF